MREREQAPFTSLYDFCDRMAGSDINKRAVENLIRSGAFDSLGARRSQLIQVYEKVMDSVAAVRRDNVEGQMDFFPWLLAPKAAQKRRHRCRIFRSSPSRS